MAEEKIQEKKVEEKQEVKPEGAEKKAAEKKEEKQEAKKEEKEISGAVKTVLDSVTKLNPEDKARLGLEIIKNLTVMELSNWVKTLEEEFGVSAAPVAVAGGVAAGGEAQAGGGAAVEEQTEFQVILTSVGSTKIQVIKEVRAMTTLGLKEAKDLVDNAPKPVKEGIPKKEAEEMKAKLEAAGAKAEIK